MSKFLVVPIVLICCVCGVQAQTVGIHSHNDYKRNVPFYQAYACGASSIEADVFVSPGGDDILVAHDEVELPTASTFDELYLKPAVEMYKRDGRAYQLLIDPKTSAEPTLAVLVGKLAAYPEVFDPTVNTEAIRVVISGNRPAPSEFSKYPSCISFDGSLDTSYTEQQLERVAMFSDQFDNYSKWNGKGYIIDSEKEALREVIDRVHAMGKPIRFWGTPDNITAWNTFRSMGVDFINTDKPEECSIFLGDFEMKSFSIGTDTENTGGEGAHQLLLDKTTVSFGGFGQDSRILSEPVPVYTPAYKSDGAQRRVKNVILLIGDGMGLSAMQATETVNGGLTMTKIKQVGLQRTHAGNDYTPDSAGAGSSIATGKPVNNRHIAMSKVGEVYSSLAEILASRGMSCGVVTTGPFDDATPAAFYGHTSERDNTDEIHKGLFGGHLSLLVGSGTPPRGIESAYTVVSTVDSITLTPGKTLCLDSRMGLPTTEQSIGLLAETTTAAIDKLDNGKGFFLVVEGAKIDYAGHARSLPSAVMETLGFDLAVAQALRFADADGRTLVIVTADHETGGLILIDGNALRGEITAIYMTNDHTPTMVPVLAYGPRSGDFGGIFPNTEIVSKILRVIH